MPDPFEQNVLGNNLYWAKLKVNDGLVLCQACLLSFPVLIMLERPGSCFFFLVGLAGLDTLFIIHNTLKIVIGQQFSVSLITRCTCDLHILQPLKTEYVSSTSCVMHFTVIEAKNVS